MVQLPPTQLEIAPDAPDFTGAIAIQAAIDSVAQSGGGTVEIPAGVYQLSNALHLRSGVRLRGEAGTILRKIPSVSSPITNFLGYGMYEFTVQHPERFAVGMGIHLADVNSGGFYTTIATIVAREGDVFFVDRPLCHDYLPQNGGRVASLFSLIDVTNAHEVAIENLVLDGNADESQDLTGCRGGGVFMIGTHGARLRNLEIHHYHGDAISFQQCSDVAVQGCHLHQNTGSGLHPGSGSVRYILENNHLEGNGRYGIFYCLRTTHSICSGNTIENNGEVGISVGERDTDHFIFGNTIRGNGGAGIDLRTYFAAGADRVRVEANLVGPNVTAPGKLGMAEIVVHDGLSTIAIVGNQIVAPRHAPLHVGSECENVSFVGNVVNGHAQQAEDLAGPGAEQTLTGVAASSTLPGAISVGPAALRSDGARHLGIPELLPWDEASRGLWS